MGSEAKQPAIPSSADVSELIEVRLDEKFDVSAVVRWMEGRDLPEGEPKVRQFGGGKANLTYLLEFPDGAELVLRRPPLGPVAASSHDMHREYTVLSSLWQSFDLAPRAFALCENDSVIGAPFILMERKGGVVVRGAVPDRFGGGHDEEANQRLSTVVIDTLVRLHDVEPTECGLDDLGHPEGFLERQVQGWARRWEKARDEDFRLADEVADWLATELPDSLETTLLHNDWRLDNMAVSPGDPGRATAVYDWDMATRGDPLADLGTLMASWFDAGEAPTDLGLMPTLSPGWLSRDAALRRYASRSGRDLGRVDWYLVFGTWKLGVILQQIYIRWLRGQTRDQRFASMGEDARNLFRLAAARRP